MINAAGIGWAAREPNQSTRLAVRRMGKGRPRPAADPGCDAGSMPSVSHAFHEAGSHHVLHVKRIANHTVKHTIPNHGAWVHLQSEWD